ncbi:MAG: hypothetical protein NXY57DRAFT_1092058 [Lentinula lateritia]|uniref:VHS domain-containing protein n=1 Tax=Lentinula lateritia TaxID=40482 RepID=A0ABQ8VJI2_9AGAR|nr:MAG: hypothetical protein NXY57DRAFT_1092058 [Lentinula lateritia]KAJ4496549.1 hypothetical protein C8R41DRAFT_918373 [Lentinula lateritia]
MSQCVEQLSGGGENNVYNDSELVGMSPFLQLCLSYDSGNFIDYHIVMTAKIIDQKLTPKNDQLTLDLCNEWLSHNEPNAQFNALSHADALSKNCGVTVNREIASRAFTAGLEKLINSPATHHKVERYALSSISRWTRKWADAEGLPTMKDRFNTLEADYYGKGSNFLSFKDIFQSKGYELWDNIRLARAFVPPNTNPRAPDGLSYDDPSGTAGKSYFISAVEKYWPARTPDNQDVLLVLNKDPVKLEILHDVAMGTKGGMDGNHVLPLLRIIEHEKLTFGVSPLIGMSLLRGLLARTIVHP